MAEKEYMREKTPRVLNCSTQTWYGLPVDVTVSSNHLHQVIVSGLALPHPGLVNMISRWGLPIDLRLELTSRHELGHLQTLPVPVLHLLLIFWPRREGPSGPLWLRVLAGLLTHQIVWELAAECYVLATDKRTYKTPRSLPARMLYAGFWSTMVAGSIMGTLFLLRRQEQS